MKILIIGSMLFLTLLIIKRMMNNHQIDNFNKTMQDKTKEEILKKLKEPVVSSYDIYRIIRDNNYFSTPLNFSKEKECEDYVIEYSKSIFDIDVEPYIKQYTRDQKLKELGI